MSAIPNPVVVGGMAQSTPGNGNGDGDSMHKDSLSAADDKDFGDINDAVEVTEETPYVIDKASERALTRKFDVRILPFLAIMVSDAFSLNDHVCIEGAYGLHPQSFAGNDVLTTHLGSRSICSTRWTRGI